MKIIKPSVEFLGEVPTDYENALAFIERCGRLCYKSESKGDPEKFVRTLIKSGHLAMVEHSNFVVRSDINTLSLYFLRNAFGRYLDWVVAEDFVYVGGNLTAWYNRCNEMPWGDVLFIPFRKIYGDVFNINTDPFRNAFDADSSPEKHIWKVCPHDEIPKELRRYSVKFICNRATSHEIVRHRPCSFAQESQRFVNYAGKDMKFIEPAGFEDWKERTIESFRYMCETAETQYGILLADRLKRQQARAVLPNATKTEIIVTADAAEWAHIKKLRTAKDADPDMQRVMALVPWEEIL